MHSKMQFRPGTSRARDHYAHNRNTRQPRSIAPALGPLLKTLTISSLDPVSQEAAEITDCEYVASYNLMEGQTKTILVPGRPPLWTPSSLSMQLKPDTGAYYRDENAARFPEHPFEPAIQALFSMNRGFDPSAIDIVGCGSTLGDLLRASLGRAEPFSFVAQAIGSSVFLVRRNSSPEELINDVHGFGHSFVETNTTWSMDTKGSSSHQTIVGYDLAGKRMLVRFEADAFTVDQAEAVGDFEDEDGGVRVDSVTIEDAVKDMLTPSTAPQLAGTTVLKRGSPVAGSSLLDIKTRSSYKDRDTVLNEQLPRLWLRQIRQLVLSFHNKGRFGPAAIDDISSAILDFEMEHQPAIKRMVCLINEIQLAVKAARGGRLEVRVSDPATVDFHELLSSEQTHWNAIPETLQRRWEQQ